MISDALNIMEAHVAMMKLENIRIVKDCAQLREPESELRGGKYQ